MQKIIIAGTGPMFAHIVSAAVGAGTFPVAVLRHEKIRVNPFLLFFKDIFAPSREKSFINGYNLKELDVTSLNSEKFAKFLKQNNIDAVFVASWSEKIHPEILKIPKAGFINIHPSLLPAYRGANPYARVILNNESKTGVTFHLMDENLDTGAILLQKEVPVFPEDNGITLRGRCADAAKTLMIQMLDMLDNSMIFPVNQNDKKASYFPQIDISETILDFKNSSAENILRKIRAFTPWTKTYIPFKSSFFTFVLCKKALSSFEKNLPGSIVEISRNSLTVVCADNVALTFSGVKKLGLNLFFTNLYMKYLVKCGDCAI
ncbi:MAG: methionyl-tRNA formyltransferase [Candidatus Gastranaerophilaceae bacterium]